VIDPLPPILRLDVRDPEILAEAIRGANLKPCLLNARPAPSRLARVVGPRTCLDFATLGSAMLFSGAMPADCFTLVYVRACPTPGRSFNFGVEHTDGHLGFFPPGGLVDAVTPAGYGNATLTIPTPHFHAVLATAFPDIPETILAHGAGMRVGPREQTRLRALLDRCEAMIWQPGAAPADPPARHHLERELLEAFLAALRSGCRDLVPTPPPRFAARHSRLRQAREFLAAHAHAPVYLDDLCSSLGLSHRGVENLFHDLLGVNPITYLNQHRLHGVRRTLLHATLAPGTVKRAALEWGFLHQGRFAHDYRTLFGETPTATLTRGRVSRANEFQRSNVETVRP
jgi:AraC-like DNA-binding protein